MPPADAPPEFINTQNCTVDAITPVVNDIKGILGDAVTQVNALVGQSADDILAGVDGVAKITVTDLAKLLGDLLTLVFTALGAVLAVATKVGGDVLGAVQPLLQAVG